MNWKLYASTLRPLANLRHSALSLSLSLPLSLSLSLTLFPYPPLQEQLILIHDCPHSYTPRYTLSSARSSSHTNAATLIFSAPPVRPARKKLLILHRRIEKLLLPCLAAFSWRAFSDTVFFTRVLSTA